MDTVYPFILLFEQSEIKFTTGNKNWDSKLWKSPQFLSAMLDQFWSSFFPLIFLQREGGGRS